MKDHWVEEVAEGECVKHVGVKYGCGFRMDIMVACISNSTFQQTDFETTTTWRKLGLGDFRGKSRKH